MAKKSVKHRSRKIRYWGHRTVDYEQNEKLEQVLDKLVDVVDDIKDIVTDIGKKVDINLGSININDMPEEKITEVVSDLDEAIDCVDDAYVLIESIRDGE